jgi:hypothetical protein
MNEGIGEQRSEKSRVQLRG